MKILYSKLIMCSIVILLLFGCKTDSELGNPISFFEKTSLLKGDMIKLDQELVGFPAYRMTQKDSLLIIYDWKKANKKFLFVVDIKNKKLLDKIVNVGWGPCEHSIMKTLKANRNDNSIYFLESNKKKVFTIGLESLGQKKKELYCPQSELILKDKKQSPTSYTDVVKIENGNYIALGPINDSNMYALVDNKGSYIASYLNYPVISKHKTTDSEINRRLFYGNIDYNDSINKIACVAKPAFLEILNVKNNTLKSICRKMFIAPQFNIKTQNGRRMPIESKESIQGFVSMDVTHKFIYVLFCDKVKSELIKSGAISRNILVFDWEGKPIKRYKLETGVLGFVVINDTDIYGVTAESEPGIIHYKI